MMRQHTPYRDDESIGRVNFSVIHHGSKPNQPDDDIVTIGVADGDRLANMGASLPIRSGQHNNKVRLLNPITIEIDPSTRSPREKYMNPDSVLWDVANCIGWYRNPTGPYALRLPKSLEIGKSFAEILERHIQDIKDYRTLVGLYPYPEALL